MLVVVAGVRLLQAFRESLRIGWHAQQVRCFLERIVLVLRKQDGIARPGGDLNRQAFMAFSTSAKGDSACRGVGGKLHQPGCRLAWADPCQAPT